MPERFRPLGTERSFSLQGVKYFPGDDGWFTAPTDTVAAAMRAAGMLSEGPSALTASQVAAVGVVVGDGVASPTTNLTAAAGAAGVLAGAYYYAVAFRTAKGITAPWPGTATVVSPSSQQVNLTNIPVSPSPLVISRVLLRTQANPTDPKDYRILAEVPDNTTTTYTDNIADGSLGAPPSWNSTNRGFLTDGSGPVLFFSDQAVGIGQGVFSQGAGYACTAAGYQALGAVTSGRRNAAFGIYALTSLTTGYQNNAFGAHAGNYLTTQIGNNFFGSYAGFYAGTGAGASNLNTGMGDGALQGTNGTGLGQQNCAFGYRALYQINTADQCVGIGPYAGQFANSSRQLFIDTGGATRGNLASQQNEGLIYGEIPNAGNVQTQRLNLNGSVRLGSSTSPTVANLPAAAAALQGCRRYVTDASVAYASANVGTTVAGGGSNCVPVFCTGTAWVIG